ncbi:MAG: hypothetical protein M3463_09345 [Verrucomicrobiota bacterium]|nr:hypothetical protein [Verrucomicrobiota bacterium]
MPATATAALVVGLTLGFIGGRLTAPPRAPDSESGAPHGQSAAAPYSTPVAVVPASPDPEQLVSDLAANLPPDDRKALEAAQRLMSSVSAQVAEYQEVLATLQQAGLVKPETLNSEGEIDERAVLVRRFAAATEPLVSFFKKLEANFSRELTRVNYPARLRQGVLRGFLKSAHVELNVTIRECDREMANTMLKILELLKREWGAWRVEPDGKVAFTNAAAAQEYQRLAAQLGETARRQETAQNELAARVAITKPEDKSG